MAIQECCPTEGDILATHASLWHPGPGQHLPNDFWRTGRAHDRPQCAKRG